MTSVDPGAVATHSFDWGVIKWFVSPDQTPGARITFGEVILLPGQGHVRHNHPESEEILYVLSGVGEQMVDDKPAFPVGPGIRSISRPRSIIRQSTRAGRRCACWRSTIRVGRNARSSTCRTIVRRLRGEPSGSGVRRNEKRARQSAQRPRFALRGLKRS